MTREEFEILDVLNIASTIHMHPKLGYRATALHIAAVGKTDPRFGYDWMTSVKVGRRLGVMAKGWPTRLAPLVEKVDSRHWRLTDAGLRALGA
jgi:hypothetical protein